MSRVGWVEARNSTINDLVKLQNGYRLNVGHKIVFRWVASLNPTYKILTTYYFY